MNVLIVTVARAMAWLGGLVLMALTLLSVLSIAGRALSGLGLGPVPGDYELVFFEVRDGQLLVAKPRLPFRVSETGSLVPSFEKG